MKRFIALAAAVITLVVVCQTAQAVTPTLYNGEFITNITITLTTPVPTGGTVYCNMTIEDVGDPTGINTESIVGQATVSGGTATCTLIIPYFWYLLDAAANSVTGSIRVGISASGTNVLAQGLRFGSHSLFTVTGVPAPGFHTVNSVSTRL